MGRNSAGVKAGTNDGGGQFKSKISNVGSLVEMKDKAMYKATKEAISRYHAVMGVRQRNVKLADLGGSAYGVHVTRGGKSEAVYLEPRTFRHRSKERGKGTLKQLQIRVEYENQQACCAYDNPWTCTRYMERSHDRRKSKSGRQRG